MICFDWYFPEAARSLALLGADVIAHPSNLVRKDCPRSMPIRALENHVFTITSNRTGSDVNAEETLTFIGKSLICDPKGDILASAGPDESVVLMAEIDPHTARHRAINATNDLFADRRPDMYTALK
jgi:predicted amidohydrolase